MLEDLVDLHYDQADASSFMQLPCFLAPSPLHSACQPDENETELYLHDNATVQPHFIPTDSAQDLMEMIEAQEHQRREIYSFLSAVHGGHFKKFAIRFGRSLAEERLKKKKINKKGKGK